MRADLDQRIAYERNQSIRMRSLDIDTENTLMYSGLYQEFDEIRSELEKINYSFPNSVFDPEKHVVDMQSLLKHDGKKFVIYAYLSILGRMPDKNGLYGAIQALENGTAPKLDQIYNMASSKEGERRNVVLTGFESKGLQDFYEFQDREFLEYAIIHIMRRLPNKDDEERFLKPLRSQEYSPIEVLYLLRHSEEGQKYNLTIIGLDEEYNRRLRNKRLYKLPVIGKGLRSFMKRMHRDREISLLNQKYFALADEMHVSKAATNGQLSEMRQHIASACGQFADLQQQVAVSRGLLEEMKHISTSVGEQITDAKQSLASMREQLDELKSQNVLDRGHQEEVRSKLDAVCTLSAATENQLRELDVYTHQIGTNVNDINRALSNYDNIVNEYVIPGNKEIQILMSEVSKLGARISRSEQRNSGAVQSVPEVSDLVRDRIIPAPAEDAYETIDYFDFENHFRGSREHIKKVQTVYLPYFEGKSNVLDLGCGRGEFTEMLAERNVGIIGVDQYAPYVEYMKLHGLPAVLDDAIHYLRDQKTADGIFVGQVVEHLSIGQILELCKLAYEKLEDGCYLIIETPNPTSLAIYTECFYMDPSHQKPVHPQTLKYIAEKAGFLSVEILFTESSRMPFSIPKLKDGEPDYEAFNTAMERVSNLLYGSQDYSIIARK